MTARFNSRKDVTDSTLVFPSDMEKKFYPEAIKFSIYRRDGVHYNIVKSTLKEAAETAVGFVKAGAEEILRNGELKTLNSQINNAETDEEKNDKIKALNKAVDQLNNARDNRQDAPEQIKVLHGILVDEFNRNKENKHFSKTIENHVQSIYLQMPDAVSFTEAIEWAGTDTGMLGGLASGGLASDGALEYGALGNIGTLVGGAVGGVAAALPGVSGIASSIIGASLGEGSGLQGTVDSQLGLKTNPFKEQTFQGVGFRPFEFSFIFRPKSQTETVIVDNIVRAFRQYSKPTFSDISPAGFFKYPHEFRIEFLTIDANNSYETNRYIPEIKYCICTGVNVNFTANGWKSFEDGAPQQLELQLSFQETELITGEDVSGDTGVGRFKNYTGRF